MKDKQPISMFILAWVELLQAIITIFSFGFITPDFRGYMLFCCEWFDKLSNWEAYK